MRIRPVAHDERRLAPRWAMVSLTLSAVILGATAGRVEFLQRGADTDLGTAVGILLAILVVWGFPSLPLRTTGRTLVLLSSAIIARRANLDPVPGDGIEVVALWLLGAVGVFVFGDRISLLAAPDAGRATDAERAERRRRQLAASWVLTIVFASLAILAVVIVAPFANDRFSSASEEGSPATGDRSSAPTSLQHDDVLDMTRRPELTDEILLTVRSEHRSFLRAQVYDRWDGTSWSRSQLDRYRLAGTSIHTAEHDLGAAGPVTVTQRIRIEAERAEVFPAAPTAVRLDSRAAAVQTLDGSLSAWPDPLGRGAVYTVTSRAHPVDPDLLRAADGPIPPAISDRYGTALPTTDRVLELGERITTAAGATTTYDRIRAFEDWMGDNLEYSLDAPPSPADGDAVDRFLFDDRLGWCEQIASSLIVFARAQGIPARMATGFVATERDRVTGDLVVRAKHAHAWAEVWFPELGWVAFDPTADVPLAPEVDQDRSALDLLRDRLAAIATGVVVSGVAGWGLRLLLPRLRRRRHGRVTSPIARLDRDLDRLGSRHGLDRRPDETATRFADRLADSLDDPVIAEAGRIVDEQLYAGVDADPDRFARVREAIDGHAGARRRVSS